MQSFIHVLDWRANVHPQVTALADDRGAAYSYAAAARRGRAPGRRLGRPGVGPGNVVAILAKNSADFLVHAFAVMRAGATPAFVNWRLSARELTEVLALVQPVAIAADAEFTGLADAAWPGARSAGERRTGSSSAAGGGGTVPPGWL